MAVGVLAGGEVFERALALLVHRGGVGADRHHPLHRPGGRLGVDRAGAADREAAAGPLHVAQVAEAVLGDAAVGHRLHRGAGSVRVLGEPGTSPQPPSPFWTFASQEIDWSMPAPPAARSAITANEVEPGQPS